MSDAFTLWVLVVAVSSATALATFGAVWFLWLRRLHRRLNHLHRCLRQTNEALGTPKQTALAANSSLHEDTAVQVDRWIEMSSQMPPEERERFLNYLRAEGFLEDNDPR